MVSSNFRNRNTSKISWVNYLAKTFVYRNVANLVNVANLFFRNVTNFEKLANSQFVCLTIFFLTLCPPLRSPFTYPTDWPPHPTAKYLSAHLGGRHRGRIWQIVSDSWIPFHSWLTLLSSEIKYLPPSIPRLELHYYYIRHRKLFHCSPRGKSTH